MTMPESVIVGEKIKSLRESKNITRQEMADRSGLSLEQIISIEEDVNLPSLAPLIKIARVLGVRLGTFLDDSAGLGPVITKKTDKIEGISFSNDAVHSRKHMDYFSLSKTKAGRHMEPFIIDIAPVAELNFTSSSHEGEEFIYVLEGTIEINYGKDTYALAAGDSIYYDSIVAHHVHAQQGTAAKILAVVYTPL
jgi:transcriptional regulator with XRE-family HTH domain